MKYAFSWNTRRAGTVYLKDLGSYGRGQQFTHAFTSNVDEALLFDSVQDAVAGIQQRALNINDVNSKLQLVPVTQNVRVGTAL